MTCIQWSLLLILSTYINVSLTYDNIPNVIDNEITVNDNVKSTLTNNVKSAETVKAKSVTSDKVNSAETEKELRMYHHDIEIIKNVIDDIDLLKKESKRSGKILWPYPLNYNPNSTNDKDDLPPEVNETVDKVDGSSEVVEVEKDGKEREARFLLWSHPQSQMMDLLMQTAAVNYKPQNSNDPFDFLRDSYPLPKGKCENNYPLICGYPAVAAYVFNNII